MQYDKRLANGEEWLISISIYCTGKIMQSKPNEELLNRIFLFYLHVKKIRKLKINFKSAVIDFYRLLLCCGLVSFAWLSGRTNGFKNVFKKFEKSEKLKKN